MATASPGSTTWLMRGIAFRQCMYKDLNIADQCKPVDFHLRSVHVSVCRLIKKFRSTDFDKKLEIPMKNGYRLYTKECASGNRIQRSKEWVREKFGDHTVAFPLAFSWDGVSVGLLVRYVTCF